MLNDVRFAIRLLARERWFTLAVVVSFGLGIGVLTVTDIRQAVASGVRPVVYLPLSAYAGRSAAILVGHHSNDAAIAARIRQEVAAVDPDVVLDNVRPLKDLRSDSRLQHMLMGSVLAAFAGIALVLSVVGLYALTAYSVLQRRHEIGIRLSLGAQTRQVVWLFLRRAALPLGAGLVLGGAGAVAAGALIRGLLIHTSPSDPLTFGGVAIIMIVVVLTACALPARRAALTSPVTILRHQ